MCLFDDRGQINALMDVFTDVSYLSMAFDKDLCTQKIWNVYYQKLLCAHLLILYDSDKEDVKF